MKIKVVRLTNNNAWYSGCVGQTFTVYLIPDVNLAWFTNKFFFYLEDIEPVIDPTAWVPSFLYATA